MTKELEWLDYMKSICEEFLSRKEMYMQLNFTNEHAVEIIKIVDTLKQLLTRLESIDNANPSEALECLEKLGTHRIEYKEGFELGFTKTMPFKSTMEYKTIQQALLKSQELERLLDHERELNNHLILESNEQEKILNILKPMLMIKKGSKDYYLSIEHYNFQDREEERIIRSWLENV